jgi:hypothetical protein
MRDDGPLDVIARKLAASGYEIHRLDEESACHLAVTGMPGFHCEITAPGSGDPQLDCWASNPAPEPRHIIAAVLSLLADPAGHPPWATEGTLSPAGPLRHAGFLPTAGRSLRRAGLGVKLTVNTDQRECEHFAELSVTNPAQPQRGTVTVDDDGGLTWQCPPAAGSPAPQAAEHTAGLLIRALTHYRRPQDG